MMSNERLDADSCCEIMSTYNDVNDEGHMHLYQSFFETYRIYRKDFNGKYNFHPTPHLLEKLYVVAERFNNLIINTHMIEVMPAEVMNMKVMVEFAETVKDPDFYIKVSRKFPTMDTTSIVAMFVQKGKITSEENYQQLAKLVCGCPNADARLVLDKALKEKDTRQLINLLNSGNNTLKPEDKIDIIECITKSKLGYDDIVGVVPEYKNCKLQIMKTTPISAPPIDKPKKGGMFSFGKKS